MSTEPERRGDMDTSARPTAKELVEDIEVAAYLRGLMKAAEIAEGFYNPAVKREGQRIAAAIRSEAGGMT